MKTCAAIETALRQALNSPVRHDLQKALAWDDSQVSRIFSGAQGIVISKIDTLVESIGYALVTERYRNAIVSLAQIGVQGEAALPAATDGRRH